MNDLDLILSFLRKYCNPRIHHLADKNIWSDCPIHKGRTFLDHVNNMLTEHFVSKEAKNATLLDEMRAQNGEISLQMKITLI